MKRGLLFFAVAVLAAGCGRTGVLDDLLAPGPEGDAGVGASENAGLPVAQNALRACMYIGGLDRIRVYGELAEPPGCAWLQFVSPGGEAYPHQVEIPEPWSLTFAGFLPGAPCPESRYSTAWHEPTETAGQVRFGETLSHGYPRMLEVDVQLQFDSGGGIPSLLHLRNESVEVSIGCSSP